MTPGWLQKLLSSVDTVASMSCLRDLAELDRAQELLIGVVEDAQLSLSRPIENPGEADLALDEQVLDGDVVLRIVLVDGKDAACASGDCDRAERTHDQQCDRPDGEAAPATLPASA